jgi:recombinase-like zinc beta ribbon protein
LLQGLAICGHCGRRLRTHYRGAHQTPAYHCANKGIVNGRGVYCLNVGGLQIDAAVAETFLQAVEPAGLEAAVRAAERLEADHDAALAQWRLTVERAHYEAQRAERRYRAVDPENRLVARGLEAQWEQHLQTLQQAQQELARREQLRPKTLNAQERQSLLAMGQDSSVRGMPPRSPYATASSCCARCSRKSRLPCIANSTRPICSCAGAAANSPNVASRCPVRAPPRSVPTKRRQAARILGTAPSTLHRWVNDGFIAGEQPTPGAPWRIRITETLRSRFVEDCPDGYVAMQIATRLLGVTRQTVLQRVKRGELDAVLVCRGRRKGWRIKVVRDQADLFEHTS